MKYIIIIILLWGISNGQTVGNIKEKSIIKIENKVALLQKIQEDKTVRLLGGIVLKQGLTFRVDEVSYQVINDEKMEEISDGDVDREQAINEQMCVVCLTDYLDYMRTLVKVEPVKEDSVKEEPVDTVITEPADIEPADIEPIDGTPIIKVR